MQVFTSRTAGDTGKFEGVVDAFPDLWHGAVLDVGCRSGNLRWVLGGRIERYVGVDLVPPADVVADLETGLPFEDRTFDVTVALDVLEHTNDLHAAFDELARVTRRALVLSLPNCYEAGTRLKILFGRPLGGKYGLPVAPPQDRHRWFFSLADAARFVHDYGAARGWRVVSEGLLAGPRRRRLAPVIRRFPGLLGKTYVAHLERGLLP